jgi:hypothetical protein
MDHGGDQYGSDVSVSTESGEDAEHLANDDQSKPGCKESDPGEKPNAASCYLMPEKGPKGRVFFKNKGQKCGESDQA